MVRRFASPHGPALSIACAMSTERPEANAFVAEVRRLTEEGLDSGMFCAEAVVSALARAQGIDSGLVPKMATAFCSGMSRTRGPCGALVGAVMGLGLSLGRSDPRQPTDAAYAATHELVRTFEREFGARDCDRLLGCDVGTSAGQATFHERRLQERCECYTLRAAEIAATLLATRKD